MSGCPAVWDSPVSVNPSRSSDRSVCLCAAAVESVAVGRSRWVSRGGVDRWSATTRRPFSCSGSLSDTGLPDRATQSTNSSSWDASGSASSDVFGLSSSARGRLRRNSPPSRPRREGCSATFGCVGFADVVSVGATSPVPVPVPLSVVALVAAAPEGAPSVPGNSPAAGWCDRSCRLAGFGRRCPCRRAVLRFRRPAAP